MELDVEGDEVLIPEPYYPNYFTFIRMAGGRVHPIPTSPEDGYRYAERARIEPHITEKTRAILLANPGNPTGTGNGHAGSMSYICERICFFTHVVIAAMSFMPAIVPITCFRTSSSRTESS